jgi:hypothetical protein
MVKTIGKLPKLSKTGRNDEAIAALVPVVERWPNAGCARFCLGNALHAAGRLADFWASTLPLRMHVQCETLVEDFEREAR